MDRMILPGKLTGEISAPPSKSAAQRILLAAALCEESTEIKLNRICRDVETMAQAIGALGARADRIPGGLRVVPGQDKLKKIDTKDSGATARFLLPVLAARGEEVFLSGAPRPHGELTALLEAHRASLSARELPLRLWGRLTPGEYRLDRPISSQFVSGLLFALPLLEGESRILVEGTVSSPYVELTREVLALFGVRSFREEGGFRVPGGQRYRSPGRCFVEGDWSAAAFFLAAGARGAVGVRGLRMDSLQADRRITDGLRAFGAQVEEKADLVSVFPSDLRGAELDLTDTPDLFPIYAVLGAHAQGETRLVGIARLRAKESDRPAALCALLREQGIECAVQGDCFWVRGGQLRGGAPPTEPDHRVVMAAALSALWARGPVRVSHAEEVEKSYPGFFEDFCKLGGRADVVLLR